jgi:uncharacterized protein YfbU (UPF0304 family)
MGDSIGGKMSVDISLEFSVRAHIFDSQVNLAEKYKSMLHLMFWT